MKYIDLLMCYNNVIMKDKILNIIIILCLFIIIFFGFFGKQVAIISENMKNFSEKQNSQIKNGFKPESQLYTKKNDKKYYNQKYNSDKQYPNKNIYNSTVQNADENNQIIIIPVNPPTELSYKTKQYVYEQRKKYVANSIFANPYYQPSEAVFGQIVDNKPWISVNFCESESGTSIVTGASEESRFINNPAMLVAIEYPFGIPKELSKEYIKKCTNPIKQLIPEKIEYRIKKKEIVVTYGSLPFHLNDNNGTFYAFNGLNARDLGYNYAYIDTKKTTLQMIMCEKNNITNQVTEFKNFIHLGGSCRVKGGCNNGSPHQPMLDFKYTGSETRRPARRIYIKLWKNRPYSPEDTPDMVEIIKFRGRL